jgi:hypothetical protein
MKYSALENFARDGKLLVEKTGGKTHTRTIRIYKVKMPNIDKCIGEVWEAYEANPDKDEYTTKNVKYKRYMYLARTPQMSQHKSWKITKKDYKALIKEGAVLCY